MQDLLSDIEARQNQLALTLGDSHRAQMGQFFTPASAARFIASMLKPSRKPSVRVLDPGAGTGILSAAAILHIASQSRYVKEIKLVAYEVDNRLADELGKTFVACESWTHEHGVNLSWDLRPTSYITDGTSALERLPESERFDAVIMNPPYRKIRNDSHERAALEAVGLRVANLYTAFLALAAMQLTRGGSLSAIVPRSFANGLYHEPFRRFLFERIGIERIHLFESRNDVFANANVLQENIILAGRHGLKPTHTRLSVSYGAKEKVRYRTVPYGEIIHREDRHQFLRIPAGEGDADIAKTMAALPATVSDLPVSVSTGRVVDFRARRHLRQQPSHDTVPLIYPGHLRNYSVTWPNGNRKPNALLRSPETLKLLLPNETYVLVKRFTSKEERRRVVAATITPADIPGSTVAIENHLNVYHDNGRGLSGDLARGLTAYLNTSFVDDYVRQFSGHTQINATDLRHLRYPSRDQLCALGNLMRDQWPTSQDALDHVVGAVLSGPDEAGIITPLRNEPGAVSPVAA